MIAKAIAWLTGGSALPWLAGVAAVAFAGVVGLWQLEAARRDAAELRLDGARRELATATAALEDRANVIAALGKQERATRELQAELEPTRRAIYAAPRSTACVASPAVRAAIDSMRAARARAAASGARPVTGAADLPAAPAGAGDRNGR